MADYQSYLASEYWKKIRKTMWGKYRGCQICGRGLNIEVHHLTYENLYKEDLRYLRLLCHKCHSRQHFHLCGYKTPLTREALEKRYKLMKWTYPIRSFRPSTFFNWLGKIYGVGKYRG